MVGGEGVRLNRATSCSYALIKIPWSETRCDPEFKFSFFLGSRSLYKLSTQMKVIGIRYCKLVGWLRVGRTYFTEKQRWGQVRYNSKEWPSNPLSLLSMTTSQVKGLGLQWDFWRTFNSALFPSLFPKRGRRDLKDNHFPISPVNLTN